MSSTPTIACVPTQSGSFSLHDRVEGTLVTHNPHGQFSYASLTPRMRALIYNQIADLVTDLYLQKTYGFNAADRRARKKVPPFLVTQHMPLTLLETDG